MKLIKCYIENFGMLSKYSCNFSSGLNCFYSLNGTGKTTLTAFIKCMLFGLEATQKTSLDDNDRKKYYPWQGGTFGGSLTVEIRGKQYTIERSFGSKASSDTFRLIDTKSGSPSGDFGDNLGEELFGIDRDGFLRTILLSEKSVSGKCTNKSISMKLSDLVGTDGNVDEFDKAMKLLEERRKFYFKKGGSGAISEAEKNASDCSYRLELLDSVRMRAEEKEARLKELSILIRECEEKKRSLNAEMESIGEKENRARKLIMYNEMKTRVEQERVALRNTLEFFGGSVPTYDEVSTHNDAFLEGMRLKEKERLKSSDPEFLTLSEFFRIDTNFTEIESYRHKAEEATKLEYELCSYENKTDSYSALLEDIFVGRVPEEEEISRHRESLKSGKKLSFLPFILFGLSLIAFGICLGLMLYPVLYSLSAVGAILLIIGIVKAAKRADYSAIDLFIEEVRRHKAKNREAEIEAIAKDLERYKSLNEEREKAVFGLRESIAALTEEIDSYIAKYLDTGMPMRSASLAIIKEKFERYYALKMKNSESEADARYSMGVEDRFKAACDFLIKYGFRDASGFDEIRRRLNERNLHELTIKRLESDLESFRLAEDIKEGELATPASSSVECKRLILECESSLTEYRRESAVLEREYLECMAELDTADALIAERDKWQELSEKYKENLSTIKMTAELLSEASDNVTARYIGKTRERFGIYESLISGSEGEFAIDTEFSVTKNDCGASREMESYSRGTKDLRAFALRLALIESLYNEDAPFIILDDPFISLDDEKLGRAKKLIKRLADERQVLYFTCSKSRAF